MTNLLHMTIENSLAELGRLLQALDDRSFPAAAFAVRLAVDELVSNVIHYGYDDGGTHQIEVGLGIEGEELVLIVADDGKPSAKLRYQWSVEKGDSSAVKFDNPQALRTRATFSKPGMYVLKLTADDRELKGSHTVTIEVCNETDVGKQVRN